MIQELNPQSRNLRLQTFGEKRITHGEVIRSSLLGDNVVCDVYLRITCIDVPDNEEAHEHITHWVRSILNIPFQNSGVVSTREYKVQEIEVVSGLIVS